MWDLIVSVPDHCLSFYFTSVASDILLLDLVHKMNISGHSETDQKTCY